MRRVLVVGVALFVLVVASAITLGLFNTFAAG